jgi:hypothetical protein
MSFGAGMRLAASIAKMDDKNLTEGQLDTKLTTQDGRWNVFYGSILFGAALIVHPRLLCEVRAKRRRVL